MFGPVTGSIFYEAPGRSEEVMLYIVPRIMDLCWTYFKKKKWVNRDFPYFLEIVFAFSVGSVCHHFVNEPDALKAKYKTIGNFLVGDKLKKKPPPPELEISRDYDEGSIMTEEKKFD